MDFFWFSGIFINLRQYRFSFLCLFVVILTLYLQLLLFFLLRRLLLVQQIQQKLLRISTTVPVTLLRLDFRYVGGNCKGTHTKIWTKLLPTFHGDRHWGQLLIRVFRLLWRALLHNAISRHSFGLFNSFDHIGRGQLWRLLDLAGVSIHRNDVAIGDRAIGEGYLQLAGIIGEVVR